jgi:hypothetical protein
MFVFVEIIDIFDVQDATTIKTNFFQSSANYFPIVDLVQISKEFSNARKKVLLSSLYNCDSNLRELKNLCLYWKKKESITVVPTSPLWNFKKQRRQKGNFLFRG